LHHFGIYLQDLRGDGQRSVEPVQQLAQIRVRLSFRRVGPKEKGQVTTRLRRVAVQNQVRQQGLQTYLIQRCHRFAFVEQLEATEQLHVQR
jgi:hypothetical protein